MSPYNSYQYSHQSISLEPGDSVPLARPQERTSGSAFGWGALLSVALLLGSFAAVVLWFGEVDFYHRYFFDTGWIVFADNLFRFVFGLILCWLVYAPGAGILALIVRRRPAATAHSLWPAERALLGFGIGIGVWHVAMMFLGLIGLYYRSIVIVLCAATLVASAKHFGEIALASCRKLAALFSAMRSGQGIPSILSTLVIILAAASLLLVRGLYPGGGGDYYTHYFYYYLEVLKNHGLAPNDVWYHYWYSKGYGLFFLGMLLTDPEAPALVTFCCVAFATLAIAVLVARMAQASLWPMFAALVYLLFNLVSLDQSGGEFQKDHEQTSALLILVAWALCMEFVTRDRLFLIAAGATGVAAAIITQSMGVIISLFLGFIALSAMLRKRWQDMWAHGLAAIVVGATVLAVLLLGYVATGLATDQGLDLTLRFSDIAKLDRWGVLPQVVIVAWIRDNYEALAPPLNWSIVTQLGRFLRDRELSPIFQGIELITLCVLAVSRTTSAKYPIETSAQQQNNSTRVIRATLAHVGALVVMLIIISAPAGRVQSVTYERFSTFFVPLLLLLAMVVCGWLLSVPFPNRFEWMRRLAAPCVLLCLVLASWQTNNAWAYRATQAMFHGILFFTGQYSLAEAYTHQDAGLHFGGINPEAYEAWRHVDSGAPIWATNVDSYCMVPGCVIESVASFKLSPRLDEIMGGPSDLSKSLLEEAGINYFLFLKNARLLDLLPHSELFAPESIGQYLGVKWTNGSAYLLTWIGPTTQPLPQDFYNAYKEKLAEPEDPWFKFSDLAKDLSEDTKLLRAKNWGAALDFRRRIKGSQSQTSVQQRDRVYILDATYGDSCRWYTPKPPAVNNFREGNWTSSLMRDCDNQAACSFRIGTDRLGDPVGGCAKDFTVTFKCGPDGAPVTRNVPAEAAGNALTLDCAPGIYVVQAAYGRSCWNLHLHSPFRRLFADKDTVATVARACNGKAHCDFAVDIDALGDRANICHTDFSLKYACLPEGLQKSARISSLAEATSVALDCPDVEYQGDSLRTSPTQ